VRAQAITPSIENIEIFPSKIRILNHNFAIWQFYAILPRMALFAKSLLLFGFFSGHKLMVKIGRNIFIDSKLEIL
jgi:hypothetical protein